ncbi:MAG: cyclic nucleotide-binding domain-containing protein [Chloroflexi bacterium]|nr:cyclic nucleotide-binding domain-containing protein [Chloroflexota bacterium]
MTEATSVADFWDDLTQAADPTAYKPARNERAVAARLESWDAPYYILKEPLTKSYLRLTEADYAVWWQMDGRKSIKDLLFYNLIRYKSLPIGPFNSLLADLRVGGFLQDTPTDMYDQVEKALAARQPASRGRRLLDGFLHSEFAITGLDDFFMPLYRRLGWLFHPIMQFVLLLIILLGGGMFGYFFVVWKDSFSLTSGGIWSVLRLLAANFIVITVHELAHGLMTKHLDRELNQGGFLIYWGMPAFFVDTRDIWLSPRRRRIAVSWAGPHSGLIIGGLMGLALTAVAAFYPQFNQSFWVGFLFQLGFIAYLTVFFNLNPLLELDGYFILMDWLDMPGLRRRAIQFWRQKLWPHFKANKAPRDFWGNMNRAERIFTFFGGLALAYSTYAIIFALYFWRSRLGPLAESLWRGGIWGQLLVLAVTAVVIIPAIYALVQLGWSRIQAGLEWLSRRNLLARPDVLALLVGLPLLAGLPLFLLAVSTLPRADLWVSLGLWLLHLAAVAALIGVARQLPGSRFQWALWSLVAAPVGVTLAWINFSAGIAPFWRDLALLVSVGGILAAGVVAWYTINLAALETSDRLTIAAFFLLGVGYGAALIWLGHPITWTMTLLLPGVFIGLMLMTPLLLNFMRSRFALPWFLLVLAILALPWLQFYPRLQFPVIVLWLYAGVLYLLVGALAQFGRHTPVVAADDAFQERGRLVNSFNHFMQALFTSYEAVFGGRRLATIQNQIVALGPLDPDDGILEIAQRARTALLLAVDRLDDLAGTPFTRQTGQAAYDSLPWLEAETLARHVLSDTDWGVGLAQGFIRARDRRAELVRLADIFSGFDQDAVQETVAVAYAVHERDGALLARAGEDAVRFFLIDSGKVGVFHDEAQMATIEAGGYFGTNALLVQGDYQFTYRALGQVALLAINRDDFDPLLRADTTLAKQVSSGAASRRLLKQMPLFSSLSPQEIAVIDARLQRKPVAAGEIIVQQGQPRSYLFIVAKGRVEALDADEKVAGNLGPGEHFGEYALFVDVPYTATYRAALDTELLLLDEPKFDELVARCEQMSHYVSQIGSGRLMATRRRLGPSAVLS